MEMMIPTWFAIGRIKRNTATTRLSTNPLYSDRIKCLRMVKSSQVVPAIITVFTASVNKKKETLIYQFLFSPSILCDSALSYQLNQVF